MQRSKSRSKLPIAPKKGRLKPISLYPLSMETALRAIIETGPITDPKLKPPKAPKKAE